MKMHEVIETLREDIEVPDIVQSKADEALEQIRKMCAEGGTMAPANRKGGTMNRKRRQRLAVCIAAAVLVIGGTCLAASYRGIGRSTEKEMKISEEQKAELEQQQGLMTFPELSVTDQGITISLQDCAVDNYGARLTFRFDGYELPEAASKEGYRPDAFPSVTVDGVRLSMGGGFYDGYYEPNDGGPCLKDENVQNYQFADGSMEYTVNLSTTERGFLLNKPIHVEFKEISYCIERRGDPDEEKDGDYSEKVIDVEGDWVLDWTLQGSDDIYEADIVDGAIGDTGAVLTHVEMSPISIKVLIHYPKKEHRVFWTDEDGESHVFDEWEMPPEPMGVKMKDGTLYYYAWCGGGGSAGYRGQNEICEIFKNGNQIVDIHQVEYLLFNKDVLGASKATEDNFYLMKVR